MQLMSFKLNRDFVLVTKEGPSFRFKKDEPTGIPPRFAADVIAIGGEALGDDAALGAEVMAELSREKAADSERLERLRACVQRMVDRNQSGDFTAGGKPNKKKVELMFGGSVADNELTQIFDLIKQSV